MKVSLITTYYKDNDSDRNNELLSCIRRNVELKSIDKLIIIIDENTERPFNHPKITWVIKPQRPTYDDFFSVANEIGTQVKIIANTDIYFDDYNVELIKVALLENQCFSLSRWDEQVSGHYIHHAAMDSQDTWIFKGIIKPINGFFHVGKCGCDNRIAYEIEKAGYEILNPSRTIKSYHLHISGIRNYRRTPDHVVPKPYKFLPPVYLGERQRTNITVKRDGTVNHLPIQFDPPKPTEFNLSEQQEQMNNMLLEGNIPKHRLLSIIIPTMHERAGMLKALKKEFYRQIKTYRLGSKVQIFEILDNGYAPIGWKRNKGNIECGGHYVAHFDDDDWPAEDYLYQLVKAIETNYGVDVITFNAEVTFDGENPQTIYYNRKFVGHEKFALEGEKPYHQYMPTHLSAIKREKTLENAFKIYQKNGAKNRKDRDDSGSDVKYAFDMVRNKTLQSDYHIDKILYYYRYKNK